MAVMYPLNSDDLATQLCDDPEGCAQVIEALAKLVDRFPALDVALFIRNFSDYEREIADLYHKLGHALRSEGVIE